LKIGRFHHRGHGEHGEEIRKKFFSVFSVNSVVKYSSRRFFTLFRITNLTKIGVISEI